MHLLQVVRLALTRQLPSWQRALAVFLILPVVSCGPQPAPEVLGIAYVGSAGTPLFSQLGPSAQEIGSLEAGEPVEILGRRPRWVQVRSASGRTGWVQEQRLVSQQVFNQFQRLAGEAKSLPSQGTALMRREANLRLESSRDSETFYQLAEGEEIEVLEHRAVEEAEDWFLIRASGERVGWVLEGAFDMNVPLEVAQYREGLRIRAWFVLRQEQDQGQGRPWYLWATIRSVAGLPYDFDEVRVFTWNPARSRYETAHRERNLIGFYPIEVDNRETPDGPAPTFRLQLEDQTGKRFWKNYILAGRLVRPES